MRQEMYILFLVGLLPLGVSSFTIPIECKTRNGNSLYPQNIAKNGRSESSQLPLKKRRRRKTDSSVPNTDDEDGFDDLPDFDLNDDEPSPKVTETPKQSTSLSYTASGDISPNMIGSTNRPVRSINELIADRSLEKKLLFDEPSDVELPDLAVVQRVNTETIPAPKSSKRERQEEAKRRAQLAAEKEKEEESRNAILNALPGIRDADGNISPLKLLETGTWACIYALVAWELYINSPFFDRAAPMAPVVY